MEQQPIYNPIIPFTGNILGGLQDGKMIIVQGQVPGHAKRFGVDFQCGSIVKPHPDIAFHFNVRYDEGTVVCNTLECERWGTEQRKPQIPIPTGSYFELIFHVRSYCFQVSVNGQHFVEYCHRLSYNRVDTLVISGDVHVNALTFKNPNVPPPYAPPAYTPIQASNVQSVFGSNPAFPYRAPCKDVKPPSQVTVSNPTVPYQAYIGNIKPQQKIKIIGTVKAKPYRFTINLKVSYYDNIALHINQRFDENAVVRNSCINKNWGTEERSLPFLPFLPGQTFEMQIVIEPTCYKILVNGRHLFNFNHRIQPLNQIDQLEVTGDVSLSLVQY
ncbi:galectin-9B-like isoform X2 [Stegostoma tigrinum]|uniref:galectin-9B-like isoform X2 n=1 Tax=Stegostoma tigrinum TaxID=3053191 RepID=UPI00286FD7AE|nr:galectin-9B-like isoform X2 [Stegostoma tigrinum]